MHNRALEPTRDERMRKFSIALVVLACATTAAPPLAAASCTPIVLPSTADLREQDPNPAWTYGLMGDGTTDLGLGGPLPDFGRLDIYNNGSAGSFALGTGPESNYATCDHCVLVYRDIANNAPGKTFFQSAGTLTLPQPPGAATLDISFTDLTLVEVTIDPDTFISTPVPGGECYVQVSDVLFANGFEPD